jgi:hypothetical protein
MNEANKYYKNLFTKIFNKMNEWQVIHQTTCDIFSFIKEDFDKIEYLKDTNNFGIFKENENYIKEVDKKFISKFENNLILLNSQL